jgi:hypothetical protein
MPSGFAADLSSSCALSVAALFAIEDTAAGNREYRKIVALLTANPVPCRIGVAQYNLS